MCEKTLVEEIKSGEYTFNIYKSEPLSGYDYEILKNGKRLEMVYDAGDDLEELKAKIAQLIDED